MSRTFLNVATEWPLVYSAGEVVVSRLVDDSEQVMLRGVSIRDHLIDAPALEGGRVAPVLDAAAAGKCPQIFPQSPRTTGRVFEVG